MMWLLNWRSNVLFLLSLFPVSILLSKLTSRPLTETFAPILGSPLLSDIGLTVVETLASMVLMPFLIPGLIRKRYRGFRVHVERA